MSISQSSTGAIEGCSLISLSLHKFSYTTSPNLQSKLLWTHLPERDNLFVVFDHLTTSSQGGLATASKVLKVVRGGDIIEQIFLENLVLQSRFDEQQSSSQSISDSSRRVVILVKRPLIAIRYQLPDGQVRRIQMNFSPTTGYDVALGCLLELGLPIRSKSSSQGPHTQTNQARIEDPPVFFPRNDVGGPSSSLPATVGSTPMSLPFQTANLPGLLVHDRDRPHSSFHTDRFSIAERNVDRPYTDPGYKPYNALHEPSRDPRFAPLEAQDPVRRSLFPLMVDEGMPTVLPAPSQTISQMLPPRRELPFPRLAPKPSTTGALNSVPGEIEDTVSGPDNAPSVALDQRAPTAVERPPPQSKSNSKSKKPRTVNSKKQQPPSKVPSQNLQSTATPDKHDESEIVRPADTNTTAVKRAPAPKTTKRAAPAKKTAVTLRSFATQTTPEPQPKSTRSFGTQVLITSLKGALIPSEEQGGWAEAINTFIEKYKDFQPRESHQTTNSTEAVVAGVRNYAEQDEEKRKAELEAILRGLIEEEGFEELVEEVDATCKRMGLTL